MDWDGELQQERREQDDDIAAYVQGYVRHAKIKREASDARRIAMREEAKRLATSLSERFGARRVFLFGSVLSPHRFHEESDLDLAVEGIAPQHSYRAIGWAMSESSVPVEVVELETAPPLLRQRVLRQGELLIERE